MLKPAAVGARLKPRSKSARLDLHVAAVRPPSAVRPSPDRLPFRCIAKASDSISGGSVFVVTFGMASASRRAASKSRKWSPDEGDNSEMSNGDNGYCRRRPRRTCALSHPKLVLSLADSPKILHPFFSVLRLVILLCSSGARLPSTIPVFLAIADTPSPLNLRPWLQGQRTDSRRNTAGDVHAPTPAGGPLRQSQLL